MRAVPYGAPATAMLREVLGALKGADLLAPVTVVVPTKVTPWHCVAPSPAPPVVWSECGSSSWDSWPSSSERVISCGRDWCR